MTDNSLGIAEPTATLHQPDQSAPLIVSRLQCDERQRQHAIHWQDYVTHGNYLFTGSELVYFPALAEEIRSLTDYPLIKRDHPLDCHTPASHRQGYFDEIVKNSFNQFTEERALASSHIHHWVAEYGRERRIPLIEAINIGADGWIEQCIIHGLPWKIQADPHSELNTATDVLDLHWLFSIDRRYRIFVEDAILGSPLLALYILPRQQSHKGRLIWYNLDTRKKGGLSDAVSY